MIDKEIERMKQRLTELEEQKRILANDEERLQREEAKCDNCGYIVHISDRCSVIGPEGEVMPCPKCKKGIIKDRNPFWNKEFKALYTDLTNEKVIFT